MARLTLTTGPSSEPVTTQEAKDHLRVDFSDDDSQIDRMIASARRWCEQITGRAFIDQTWTWKLDRFPEEVFDVPRPPLSSVNHIQYTDEDGATSTISASDYIVDTDSTPGRIGLKHDVDWPTLGKDLQRINAVEVEFVAGYGSSASDVPEQVKSAILLVVGHLYENREEVVTNKISERVKGGVKSLLASESAVLHSGYRGSTITNPPGQEVL